MLIILEEKVDEIVKNANIDVNVYNRKMAVADGNFMTPVEIYECVKQLKKCEGYDRISQRILIDGIVILINPLSHLFILIYRDKL